MVAGDALGTRETNKKTKRYNEQMLVLRSRRHRCVWSALDPPRSIPNRVVKRRSAEGTGGMTPWETRSMHLRPHDKHRHEDTLVAVCCLTALARTL